MFVENALKAIQMLIDVASHVGDGSIVEYFNGFELDGIGIYKIIEAIVSFEKLGTDNKDLPESEKEEIVFAALVLIKTAINHDKKAIKFFNKVNCKKHTGGMGYTAYIDSIWSVKKMQSQAHMQKVISTLTDLMDANAFVIKVEC